MDLIKIPFVKKVGIKKFEKGNLGLPFSKSVHNHLQTIHASAQFSLAETASGEILQQSFPELVGKVIPVLRESRIKFKKPAIQSIIAYPEVSDDAITNFREQFSRKGRALISVKVTVKDIESITTCIGEFSWFIQSVSIKND
jgi:acyl-coenzyme A thioesterase PaaI-like protein